MSLQITQLSATEDFPPHRNTCNTADRWFDFKECMAKNMEKKVVNIKHISVFSKIIYHFIRKSLEKLSLLFENIDIQNLLQTRNNLYAHMYAFSKRRHLLGI